MPDRPITESAEADSREHSPATRETAAKTRVSVGSGPAMTPWLTYLALALAVIGAILGALAYFHPMHSGNTGVAQQSGDAKANVCSAYAATHRAVVVNTHLQSQNPDLRLAIAANARLALIGGGSYLRERLVANTAAPNDLSDAANSFANTVEQLGINYMTDSAPEVQDQMRKDLDSQIANLDKLCA